MTGIPVITPNRPSFMKALDELWIYSRCWCGRTAMRRKYVSEVVPSTAITDIGAFQGVVSIVLRDGEITREEKRLVIKLAGLLGLPEDVPKRVYDAIVDGEKLEGGSEISKEDCLRVYSGMFQTAYLNASISEDEYLVVAYLRYLFEITEEENEEVMNGVHAELEEHVEKNVRQVVEKGVEQAKDIVDGLFNRILSILPEGGNKADNE
ncbi:MAG: hypothetical protein VYC11_01615 [Candidatus Thermoplasmatota archaeon]|nr:hypothetical protein [Candidatus Thermoplasmatota archaeon]